jgi:long-chain acyl-CoA synthetase
MNLLWPIILRAITKAKSTAVIDDRRSYSYGQILGGALHLAEKIQNSTDNRHVGIMLPTSGAFPMALLGAWLANRVAVPLNYLLAPEELEYVIKDSGVDFIISADMLMDHLEKTHGDQQFIPPGVKVMRLEQHDFSSIPTPCWPPWISSEDLAVLLYTSGTSGRPKGVMLSHGNLYSDVKNAVIHSGITNADTFLGVLPQFHSFGLTGLTLLPLYIGSKIINSSRFVPRQIVRLIKKHRPDVMMAVPSMYGAMLSVKQATAEDFKSVRMAVSGGVPLPNATYQAYIDRFNVHLLEGYGLTETSPVTHWSTPTRTKLKSVGPPLPCVTQIVIDQNDQTLGPGEEGEILMAGPNIMQGYYQLPKQTAEVFVDLAPDGGPTKRFFRTGDIGHFDEDGFLFITGRKKEMLIIGGENVFPREIEEVLNKHASVSDSAVIGKMDGMRGEVPVAFVELYDDAEFDDKDLRSWCRNHLASYKVPREIRHIETLPRNATGKIMRRKLKAD